MTRLVLVLQNSSTDGRCGAVALMPLPGVGGASQQVRRPLTGLVTPVLDRTFEVQSEPVCSQQKSDSLTGLTGLVVSFTANSALALASASFSSEMLIPARHFNPTEKPQSVFIP